MSQKTTDKSVVKYHTDGLSLREIAKRLKITKYQVEKIIMQTRETTPGVTVKKEAATSNHVLEPYREKITQWIHEKNLPAALIHKRLTEMNIPVSISSVHRYLGVLRKQNEVYMPVVYVPGQQAQVDFGYFGLFKKGGKRIKAWVFCMVLSYSKYAFYKVVTDQTVKTFLKCHREAFEYFGGVPHSVRIDNLRAGVQIADSYQPVIQQQYQEMMQHYNSTVLTARICRGQDKGVVESGIRYVKHNFLKNFEGREYETLVSQLEQWNRTVCNLRNHKTTRKTPAELFREEEKVKLHPLPCTRYDVFDFEERTVNSYGHVYHAYNNYSVPYCYTGQQVKIAVNDSIIKIFKDGQQIALHALGKEKGKFITEENHKPLYKRAKTPKYYAELMEKIGPSVVILLNCMIEERPFEWKRMANGILNLEKQFTAILINQACERAVMRRKCEYRFVKDQCKELIKLPQEAPAVKRIKGFARDLKKYDQFVTRYVPNSI